LSALLDRVEADLSVEVTTRADLLGDPTARKHWAIASRDLLGFDVVLEELDDHPLVATP
jgi:hypothetical protein